MGPADKTAFAYWLVSLDEGDNDPVRFWDYVIAALKTIQTDLGKNALMLLHSTQTFSDQILPIKSVLTSLINDLAVPQVISLSSWMTITS